MNKERIYNEYKDLRGQGLTSKEAYDYMKSKKSSKFIKANYKGFVEINGELRDVSRKVHMRNDID